MELDQLIAALASPPGGAATGIIRISGQPLQPVLEKIFDPDDPQAWRTGSTARRIPGHCRISQVSIPCSLMWWPRAKSYTGQPTAELHLPGSPPILERVLAELYHLGARPARPGEFTLRSFLAGKIDLVQAEAVLGVIDAHDDQELKTALDQLAGGISSRLLELRNDLLDLLSDLEAGLDFVEEDIEFVSRSEFVRRIARAGDFVESLMTQSSGRMTSDVLPKVVLAGLPNAGKSTLFNALSGQSLALTSPERGTTRDYLQARISTNGLEWELVDTAGWEVTSQGISLAAQQQRGEQFDRAALILWCTAADQTGEEHSLDEAALASVPDSTPVIRVLTKCDLPDSFLNAQAGCLKVSAARQLGLTGLREHIAQKLKGPEAKSSAWLGMTAARCRDSLEHAASALHRGAIAAAEPNLGEELLAVDLREAIDHLGNIVGAVYTDDLLDRIFSKFCIGK